MVDYEELSTKVCDFLKRAIVAASKNTLSVQDLDERVKRLEERAVLDNRKIILDESTANRDGRPPISDDKKEIGRNLRLNGKTYAEIAETVGISVASAHNYFKDVVPLKAKEQAPEDTPAVPAPTSTRIQEEGARLREEAIANGRVTMNQKIAEYRARRERENEEQAAAEAAATLGENTGPKAEQNNGRANVKNLDKF